MASGARIKAKWFDEKVKQILRDEMRRRMPVAGEMLRKQLVVNITKGSTRSDGPSAPGQFPHRNLGKLAQSYFAEFDPATMTLRIGSPQEYAKFLETGTRRMASRPHLRETFYEATSGYGAVYIFLSRPMRGTRGGGRFQLE